VGMEAKRYKLKVNYNSHYNGYLKYENRNVKEMKTLFAIDKSGSTYFGLYKKEVTNIVNNNYEKERGDAIYIWGDELKKLTKEEFLNVFKGNENLGRTFPKLIVDIIKEEHKNNFKHLVIITDGNVSDEEINEVDKLMEDRNYNYEFVSVYIIGDKGDMSIGAPFCRRIPNKTYIKKYETETEFKEMATLNKEDMMILEKIEEYNTYSDFMKNYHKIKNAVQAKYIGTLQNKELEIKLKTLFKNIAHKEKNKISTEFIQRKNISIGMTQGSLQKAFNIENINAAISTYMENSENKKFTNCLMNLNKRFFKNNYLDKKKNNNKILLQNHQIIDINRIPFKNEYKTQFNKIDEFHKKSNEINYNKNETNSTRNKTNKKKKIWNNRTKILLFS
jgi:hypothetical protein